MTPARRTGSANKHSRDLDRCDASARRTTQSSRKSMDDESASVTNGS
jgi:hypothetical protein